jgi:hypothetical protein
MIPYASVKQRRRPLVAFINLYSLHMSPCTLCSKYNHSTRTVANTTDGVRSQIWSNPCGSTWLWGVMGLLLPSHNRFLNHEARPCQCMSWSAWSPFSTFLKNLLLWQVDGSYQEKTVFRSIKVRWMDIGHFESNSCALTGLWPREKLIPTLIARAAIGKLN